MTDVAIPCIAIPPEDAERLDDLVLDGFIHETVAGKLALEDAYRLGAQHGMSLAFTRLDTALREGNALALMVALPIAAGDPYLATIDADAPIEPIACKADSLEAVLRAAIDAVHAARVAEVPTHAEGEALLRSAAGR
jgi:hypothetical protein